jgi:hypothetical protein
MTPVRYGKRVVQGAGIVAVTAALAGTAVTNRAALAASVAVLGHLPWIWILAVIVLESASMAALAGMQWRLLAAGGARVRVRSMLATTLAGNALSVSVPLAGPELGTAFAFRRFTRQGADAPLAVWSLVVGGVLSTATAALVVVGGGLSSGNIPIMAAAVATGLLGAAALAAAVAVARRPRPCGALERPAAWMLQQVARRLHRPAGQPSQVIQSWVGQLGSLRLSRSDWITVSALALANWLADAAVFAVSIQAVGAAIPWRVLLLAYSLGIGAQTLNITPGNFGIIEGTLGLTLVAAGLRASQALAAVLLYRLVSFWLIASAGWLVLLWLRRHRPLTATSGLP